MRKLLLLSVTTWLFASLCYSQTSQGTFYLSGSTNLNFASVNSQMKYDGESIGDKITSQKFSFAPSMGYFINDGLAIGLGVDYTDEKQKYQNEEVNSKSMLIGPFAKYYIGSSNVKPFVSGDFMIGSQEDNDGKAYVSGWDLGAGIAVFVGKTVSIDFGIGYGNITFSNPDDSKAKIVSSGIGIDFGVSVYL